MTNNYKSLFMKFFPFIFFLFSIFSNAQMYNAKVKLNSGQVISCKAKLISKNRLKIQRDNSTKKEIIHFKNISSLTISKGDIVNRYVYLQVKEKKFNKNPDKRYEVLREVVLSESKVSLFVKETEYYNQENLTNPGGFERGFPGGFYGQINNYYLKKADEDDVVHLGSNALFSKNFTNGIKAYFNDCIELINKVEQREFKNKDIQEIVEFYNNNC